MAKTVYTEPGQNIFDICLQELGSIEWLVDLHIANGWEAYPKDIVPGEAIVIPDVAVNLVLVGLMSSYKPSTNDYTKSTVITEGGIGFMGIEIDFIVS